MNAIILAAGMGTRLRPLTNDRPKCMVEVNGISMVERQIQFLHDTGITDITLVSGYKAECLNFLKSKYGVDIIFNDKYDVCNNIYSLFLVKERLKNTYIIEGDVYLYKNCFTTHIQNNTYFSVWKDKYTNEWGLKIDKHNKLKDIIIGNGSGYIMSGISFWNEKSTIIIRNYLTEYIKTRDYTNLFWDNIILEHYNEFDITLNNNVSTAEIDTIEDLNKVICKVKELENH